MKHYHYILAFLTCCFSMQIQAQTDIWVAPNGVDTNLGTKENPLQTVSMAIRKVREMRRLSENNFTKAIHIYIREGQYQLYEPITIRPEDAGTSLSPTIIEAAPNEKPIISGGISLSGWTKVKGNFIGLPKEAIGKVWVADAPKVGGNVLDFRQLWVNNQKAIRAKDTPNPTMNRIVSWNKKEETCWIPTPKFPEIAKAIGVEMFIHQWWAIANLRIKKMEVQGDSTKLSFFQPESKIQSEHPWPAPWISKETGNSAFYLTNAIQFLNEAGEWFLDKKAEKLYYIPRANEVMEKAEVIVPSLETLVRMEGTIDHQVSHVFFKNITFCHTSWLRPSQQGHVPHQAGLYMLDAYKLKMPGTPDKKTLENQAWVGRPKAAVEVSYANHTGFESCRFEHLASTGLDYHKGVHDNFIKGNLFKDIGGTGIQAGVFADEATEIHLPYNPSDEREICTNLLISNNLISDVTNEDWGAVGIGAGFVKGINIEHNDISEVSYSGISMGWGWTKTINAMKNNYISANKIHHYAKHMYDVAAIYTLSAQPGSVISENYVDSIYKAPYAHIPNHWFYLYTDEGSSYFTIKDNWSPSAKFLQNANGPGNTWQNNGPQVADSIKVKAGIQAEYAYLLKDKKQADKYWEINVEKPVIVELISENGQTIDRKKLDEILLKSKVSQEALFQWENHVVIFDKVQDVYLLRERLKNAFPKIQIKTYDDLFYEFNQEKCKNGKSVKEWSHTILTANLVADTTLQKEYLSYHATQFEKWPEVSQGFCNADFQQLLIYKNGRQLMRVISIPKGESLDKLNPKTIENNPKMVEWNQLMTKYQEGIAGTKKGEMWVALKPAGN